MYQLKDQIICVTCCMCLLFCRVYFVPACDFFHVFVCLEIPEQLNSPSAANIQELFSEAQSRLSERVVAINR